MSRHDHPEMHRLRVYDWSNGSFVDLICDGFGTWLLEFSFVSDEGRKLLRLQTVVHDPPQQAGVSFSVMLQPLTVPGAVGLSRFMDQCMEQVLDIAMPDAAKKLRGFLRDAGVGRRVPSAHDLVWKSGMNWQPALCEEPFFVPEDRWIARHREAQDFVEPVETGGRKFLGFINDFSLDYTGSWTARGGFFASRFSRQQSGATLEKAVDNFLRERLIFPESERAAWEAEHVEHGAWVCPSAEEVELYRLLGEALPLFWVSERLEPWAAERRAASGEP